MTNNLKTVFSSFLLLSVLSAHSQDIIKKTNGTMLKAKIASVDLDNVHYKLHDDLDGELLFIKRAQVNEIIYENGTSQVFNVTNATTSTVSLEDTKAFIVNAINEHGFEADDFRKKYVATFEGEYLKLLILNKKGEPTSDEKLFDFSNVYKFGRVDLRTDDLAYINIYVAFLKNEKRNKWDKIKITMRTHGPAHAESILNALKHYNSLLLKKEKGNSLF